MQLARARPAQRRRTDRPQDRGGRLRRLRPGGAFSGKDPTKVDRPGAYAARYLTKNLVAAGLADRAEIALAYFIGAKQPAMQEIETFGTVRASEPEIAKFVSGLTKPATACLSTTLIAVGWVSARWIAGQDQSQRCALLSLRVTSGSGITQNSRPAGSRITCQK